MERPLQRDIATPGFPLSASSWREIYREITDSPETLSAYNMPRGLDLYVLSYVWNWRTSYGSAHEFALNESKEDSS